MLKTTLIEDPATEVEEVALAGGRLTLGVVRVGETVRRPAKASSSFVAELLGHLQARVCSWAPRYLGQDASGRDVLSYLEGSVPAKWRTFGDAQLRAAAVILRALHDATWNSKLSPGGVVCHHDPGPNNFVFRDDLPVALIDFDMAAPGSPLEDLGYMAWAWCLSSNPLRGSMTAQARQVRTLADAYGAGVAERAQLPEAIIERTVRNERFWSIQLQCSSDIPTAREKLPEFVAWSRRERAYVEAHRADLARELG
ncbi:MAG TPA: aminoglycoside phosphotransferase family protein [Polyangiaceae bacterium]|nr:aminoglycoside phosphotransferase family protein [Polyangiaceae bacterium]